MFYYCLIQLNLCRVFKFKLFVIGWKRVRVGLCVCFACTFLSLCPPPFFRMRFPIFVFCFVFLFVIFYMCVCGHPADLDVGEPRPGVRGEEGGASPLAAARTSGRGQCGFCCPRLWGNVYLPLATGALWLSVWPTCVVQHRGRAGRRQQQWCSRTSKQSTGKSSQPVTRR